MDELLPRLGAEWRPNFRCNDLERHARRLRLHAGQLDALTFDEAVIFHDKGQFSSLQLRLRSSARLLAVRVRWLPEMVVEMLLDQPWRLNAHGAATWPLAVKETGIDWFTSFVIFG